MWKGMWGLKVQGKIKQFLWRAYHGILPTGHKLKQKGLDVDEICQGCGEDPETIEHMFFQCKKAQIIRGISPVNWEGIQDLTKDFPMQWKKVCSVGKQEFNQRRVEFTTCLF